MTMNARLIYYIYINAHNISVAELEIYSFNFSYVYCGVIHYIVNLN